MKYIVLDQIKNGDLFTTEFDEKEKAVAAAEREWTRLTDHDRRRREYFEVIESANPDEEAENHFDGSIIWKAEQEA